MDAHLRNDLMHAANQKLELSKKFWNFIVASGKAEKIKKMGAKQVRRAALEGLVKEMDADKSDKVGGRSSGKGSGKAGGKSSKGKGKGKGKGSAQASTTPFMAKELPHAEILEAEDFQSMEGTQAKIATQADWCKNDPQSEEPTVCVVTPTEATDIMKEILKGESAPKGPAASVRWQRRIHGSLPYRTSRNKRGAQQS